MTASSTRTRLVVALVAVATITLVLLAASGAVAPLLSDDSADRPDDPSTEDTVGYVDGYWYDDELPVDDREDAVLEDDELEAAIARSMARVEVIRDLTFEDDVPVDVISREEFQDDQEDLFLEADESERLERNVTYEALFVVDDETDATDELEAMYGGTVQGYYDPTEDRIVLVSDSPETPEVDEVVLGHELLHALQDQHFDLTSFDRETIDQDNAKNGLVEGDAVWVDTEYEDRCEAEWDCVLPAGSDPPAQSELNWGIYMTVIHPYQDGPDYVDHLLEGDDGWTAVNEAYDDPPASSSTVIHHEDRDPIETDVDDRSDDTWQPLEVDGEVATQTVGEAGMVAMFGADAHDQTRPSVIERDDLLEDGLAGYEYDQPYTDGWAGDRLVTYVDADAVESGDAASDDVGYVWQTEWRSDEDADEFLVGYLELLEIQDAEPVDDRQDAYVIDDDYPGAYALERDGETVTIVRAPSVDDLDAIAAGAAPEGQDTLDADELETDSLAASDGTDDADSLAGVGAPGAMIAVSIVVVATRARGRSVRVHDPRRTAAVDADARSPVGPETDRRPDLGRD